FQGFFLPHLLCDAVHPNGMQTGIPGSDLKGAACSGVSVFCSLNVLSEAAYDSQSVPFKKKCCCRAQHRTSEFYSLCRSGDGFGLNDAAFGTDDTEGSSINMWISREYLRRARWKCSVHQSQG